MMNVVARFFLLAKHWQVFFLLVVIPTVAETAATVSVSITPRSFKDFGRADFLLAGITMLYMLCFLTWFWSLGSFLNSIVKPELRLRTTFLRFALIYPITYLPFFLSVFFDAKPARFAVILPLHFLAMFCLFYCLRFVAKTLTLAETGKPASFYDYAGPFFLLWFYPVGIWIVQPRVNRLYMERSSVEPSTTLTAG